VTAADILFWCSVACNLLMLAGEVWCIAFPARRIHPMSAKGPLYCAMGSMFGCVRNTSALPDGKGFVTSGPYTFTRNPRYVGDIMLFAGASIVANSERVAIPLALVSLVFVVAPILEGPWLVEQYGRPYRTHCERVPRFA